VFSFEPGRRRRHAATNLCKPVEVQITGSILTYDIRDPLAGKRRTGEGIVQRNSPICARIIREGYVR
jgi:hypothetical protein